MFTGLVEATGTLAGRAAIPGGQRLRIESSLARELRAGDSVAVNGVCLTVASVEPASIEADAGPETLRVTTLGAITPGTIVNLERPLRADGRLGGHFVQGHVDGTGVVVGRRPFSDFEWMTVGFPPELAPYLVLKGSIAVDGISLTVADLDVNTFRVQVVPFTLEHTNLRSLGPGARVNLECDLLGKYVGRALQLAGLPLQEVK